MTALTMVTTVTTVTMACRVALGGQDDNNLYSLMKLALMMYFNGVYDTGVLMD